MLGIGWIYISGQLGSLGGSGCGQGLVGMTHEGFGV